MVSQIGTCQGYPQLIAIAQGYVMMEGSDLIQTVTQTSNQGSRPYSGHDDLGHSQPHHSPPPRPSGATKPPFHQEGILGANPERKHHNTKMLEHCANTMWVAWHIVFI